MNAEEIMKAIREGVTEQVQKVIELDGIPQLEAHAVTQSYLLLQILDKLDDIYMSTDSDGIISAIKDNTMGRI